MSIFAISDLHLAMGADKPMDIFGDKWKNYMERIRENWNSKVTDGDTVLVPGDISWAMTLKEAVADFAYLEALKGTKIFVKGNHDFWWSTKAKIEDFCLEYGLNTVRFLHNNSYIVEGAAICGSRGWICPGDDDYTGHDMKIYNRERNRLILSLESIKGKVDRIIVMTHYPPFPLNDPGKGLTDILKDYNVECCVYGHLHAQSIYSAIQGVVDGINYRLISADSVNFEPILMDG